MRNCITGNLYFFQSWQSSFISHYYPRTGVEKRNARYPNIYNLQCASPRWHENVSLFWAMIMKKVEKSLTSVLQDASSSFSTEYSSFALRSLLKWQIKKNKEYCVITCFYAISVAIKEVGIQIIWHATIIFPIISQLSGNVYSLFG